MMKQTPMSEKKMSNPTYFVTVGDLGTEKPSIWVQTNAKTLDGAKRLAAKLPRFITTVAKVAISNVQDEFVTVATLSDFSAITRRRPKWRLHLS